MFTPYEELEYLSDHLPEEGESLLVTRTEGELVCQHWEADGFRDGIEDPALYGMLVQCNEALNARATLPLWACGVGAFWFLAAAYTAGGLGWEAWWLVPGVGLTTLWFCFQWIRQRQRRTFEAELRPRIHAALGRRGSDLCSLLAGIRQHIELRTLLDQFAQCPETSRGRFDGPE